MRPEAGKVIDAIGSSPALLAILVLQLATLLMIYFVSTGNAGLQQERELALIENCQAPGD